MRIFAWLRDWKRLKIKNTILADENYRLTNHNELLIERNQAYSIENAKSGRKILGLQIDKQLLSEMLSLNRKPGKDVATVHQEIQQLLTFKPHS